MNLGKSEVKVEVANEIGCRLDDMLEASQKDLYRLEGAAKAFQSMGQAIDGLFKIVDQEMDEGKFDLEAAAHIKRFIKRAHQMSVNLNLQAENNRFMQLGRIQGAEQAVNVAKKFKDEELSKALVLQKALDENRLRQANGTLEHTGEGERPVAIRPGMTLKEQRLAEDAAAAAPPPEASSSEEPPSASPSGPTPKSKTLKNGAKGKRASNA